LSAYLFVRTAESWRLFWQERHIDADALIDANCQRWLLRFCKERRPGVAPCREELAARCRRPDDDAL
jgi:hypothetical protein